MILSFQDWIKKKIITEEDKSPNYSFDGWLKQTQGLGDTISSMKDRAKKKDQELDDDKKKKEEEKEEDKEEEEAPKNQEAKWSKLVNKLKKATEKTEKTTKKDEDDDKEDSSTQKK